MALVLKDRVKETTTTTSTGAYTLAGAVGGYQSFSVIGNANTTYYAVTNGTDWEVGIGTYTASGTILSRDTILESSNSGNAVNWGAGTKEIFCTYPAERSMYVDGTTITPAISARLGFANLAQGSALSVLGVTGNSTADNASIAAATDNQVLRRSGTSLSFGAVNLASSDAVTGDLPFSNLAQGSALSVLGVTGNATADNASIAAGTDHQVLRRSGTAVAFGAVNLAQAAAITGTLPVGNGGTGITSFGSGVATWLGTPSSANLAAAVTDETGSGALVFATSPTLVTPVIGAATGTSLALTGGSLTTRPAATQDGVIISGRAGGTSTYNVTITPTTLSASRTLTLANGDTTLQAGTMAVTGTGLGQFASTTSLQLAGVISDETGSGSLVFATSPTLVTPILGVATATSINKVAITAPATSATLTIANGKTLTANNSLTLAGTDATTMTFPGTSQTIAGLGLAQTFTAAQTFRAANAIRSEAASTQDAIVIAGRAGGSSSYAITLTPATLAASRTLTLPEPGSNETLGYINTPIISQSAAYTLVLTDAGKTILHPDSDNNARTFTIPANGSVAYPVGTVITFVNMKNTLTIAITTDTMYLAGPGTTGSRTLAEYGVATAVKLTSTTWLISGNGLT